MPLTGTKVLLTAALFPLGRSPYSDGTSCSLMILGDAPETQEKIKQVSACMNGGKPMQNNPRHGGDCVLELQGRF